MAVKIRLMRVGKRKQPTYRVVVADVRSPRDGRFIEMIGHYAPRQEPSEVVIDGDRAVAWLQKGAQPTDQVARLLDIAGVWEAFEAAAGRPAKAKPKARSRRSAPAPAPAEPEAPVVEAPAGAPQAETATPEESSE